MNHLTIINFRTLSVLFFLGFFSFVTQAQETYDKEKNRKEAEEFFKYAISLEKSKVLQKKSLNGSGVPLPIPPGVNPFTSQGLEKGNVRSWRAYLQAKAKLNTSSKQSKKPSTIYKEKELIGKNSNNNRETAERISGFSSNINQKSSTLITGTLGEVISEDDILNIETVEDNSFIDQATLLQFSDSIPAIKIASALEDIEKVGQLSGDLDIYKIDMKQDEVITIEVTPEEIPGLNPFLLVYDSDGFIINFFAGTGNGQPFNAVFTALEDDVINFILVDFQTIQLLAPTDIDIINSNAIFPLGINGSYEVQFSKIELDTDAFQVPLQKGDVFGIAATNNQFLITALLKPDASLGIATPFYGIFSTDVTPLPIDGNVGFHYIAPEDGLYTLVLQGVGDYSAEIDALRPGLETERRQYIYLDFTGATDFTQREFFKVSEDDFPIGIDPELDRERFLSPLSSFLTRWDIDSTRGNTVRLAKMITDVVEENLKEELIAADINPNLDVRIISDFGIDRLGERLPRILEAAGIPYSRVLVGGTIEESGINTIGIANAIDVGNYSATDDALTLLDVMSESADIDGDGIGFPTINNIPFSDNVTKMDLVAEVVGNVTTHEAGHYLGNFHTTNTNETFSIMDEGGAFFGIAGLFPGGTFGQDDINIKFTKDIFSLSEGFSGLDETDVNTAFALSTGRSIRKSDDDTFYEDQIVALEAQAIKELYKLLPSTFFSYPAPVSIEGVSNLVVNPVASGNANIALYDIQGRKISDVFEGALQAGEPLELTVDFSKLKVTSGYYFYKMITSFGEETYSLIVK